MKMRTGHGNRASGLLRSLVALVFCAIALSSCAQSHTHHIHGSTASAQNDCGHILFVLPADHRAHERIVDGHQPWRSCPISSALHEVRVLFNDFGDTFQLINDDAAELIRELPDDCELTSVLVRIQHDQPLLFMPSALIEVALRQHVGSEVWVATSVRVAGRPH
jgi:hypothetical protein